jgi:hypothetical protein
MQFSLKDIIQQALNDDYSSNTSSRYNQSRIIYGIKIVEDSITKDIQIYNITKGGDYYKEINEEEYNIFLKKGWRYGVYVLSLNNIRTRLDNVESYIKEEVNGRLSKKAILKWKTSRINLMAKYSKITKKLNQLKSE